MVLNSRPEVEGGSLFIRAPRDARAPQGVWINSAMYGFVEWAERKAKEAVLTSDEVYDEHARREGMINVEFRENYEECALDKPHYVTIVAARKFTGDKEKPLELLLGYDNSDDVDGLADPLTRALALCEDPAEGGEDDEDEAYGDTTPNNNIRRKRRVCPYTQLYTAVSR